MKRTFLHHFISKATFSAVSFPVPHLFSFHVSPRPRSASTDHATPEVHQCPPQ
ncbi:MAG: hypothetical protein IJV33_01360 [Bacteroidaceae bacterium]|nr:hypothetical protein [Bacteroidaceae bacterium]